MSNEHRVLIITSLELRSPLRYFTLSFWGLKITLQLRKLPCVKMKNRGFWKSHYTMTLWESQADADRFTRSGAHREAMAQSAKLASEIKTLRVASPTVLPWKEAIQQLRDKGRVLKF